MISYRYDTEAEALDIRLGEGIVARTVEFDTGTLADVDQDGRLIAIEVIQPARAWPLDEILDRFEIDENDAAILRTLGGAGRSFPFAEPAEIASGSDAGELVPA